jgi:hypothetical protein
MALRNRDASEKKVGSMLSRQRVFVGQRNLVLFASAKFRIKRRTERKRSRRRAPKALRKDRWQPPKACCVHKNSAAHHHLPLQINPSRLPTSESTAIMHRAARVAKHNVITGTTTA